MGIKREGKREGKMITIDKMKILFSEMSEQANTAGMHIKDYAENVMRIPEKYPANIKLAAEILLGKKCIVCGVKKRKD